MGAIDVALFDLGGVVFDFALADRARLLAADCGLDESTVYERLWRSGLTRDFDEGRYTSLEWYEVVRERLGLGMDYERFRDVYLSPLQPRPAVAERRVEHDRQRDRRTLRVGGGGGAAQVMSNSVRTVAPARTGAPVSSVRC